MDAEGGQPPGLPERIRVIGSAISCCTAGAALQCVDRVAATGPGGYVCFTNAHGAVMGRQDAQFRAITADSLLSLADGVSVYWAARARGAHDIGHVPGPDFMWEALRRLAGRRHYFYGGRPEVLAELVGQLRAAIPGLTVCGMKSPPFRAMTAAEQRADLDEIRACDPEFIWVGLGAPKQERWMSASWRELRPAVLLGVGAAFDFHAGNIARAPAFMRRLGLEWLHRLAQEPRRLWRRYLVTNCLFLYYLLCDFVAGSPARD